MLHEIMGNGRGLIYSLAEDEFAQEPGAITNFLQAAGKAEYAKLEADGQKSIRVAQRANDWDGIDIQLSLMGLKPGNSYTIQVKGRVDGPAPEGARVMLQILPSFNWRCAQDVKYGSEFVLIHTLSVAEMEYAEAIRVASNAEGAEMPLIIYDVEVSASP